MEMKSSNNKGITLVALVITIIVLLILTGVAISLVTGENGILKRAKDSTEGYNSVAEEEKDKLDKYDKIAGASVGNIGGIEVSSEEKAALGWSLSRVNPIYVTEAKDYIVPVPKGFYYVGGNKSTGIVISDSISDMNKGDTHEVAQTLEGNQFVWIPIDNIDDLYYKNTNQSKVYDFQSGGRSSVGSGMTEPTFANGSDFDAKLTNLQEAGTTATTKEQFGEELKAEYNKMIESVKKYKGFYVGRYETGDLTKSTVVVKANNTDITKTNWYTKYRLQKELYKDKANVESGMIWGGQWFAILRYINTNYSTYGNFVTDASVPRGNHTTNKVPTGSKEAYKVNNMYDIAGNASEDTMIAGGEGRKAFGKPGQSPSSAFTAYSNADSSRVQMYISI